MSGRVSRVVMAADDGYAMPFAVTGRSIIRHLDSTRSLELYVFDTGISSVNREKINASLQGAPGSPGQLGYRNSRSP